MTDEPDVENGLVLTLDRLLEYITATPGTVRLAIETKHPTRHTRKVEEALVDCLRRYGLLGNGRPVEWAGQPAVRMMSFSQLAVRRMRDLAPGVPTVQLIGKRLRPVRRELLQRQRDGGRPRHRRCCASDPELRRRRPRGRQAGARLDGQPARRHGPRARPRASTPSSPTTPTRCCAASAATPPPPSPCAEVALCPRRVSRARAPAQARSVSSRAAVRSAGVS